MDFATLIGLLGALALIASAVILGVSPDVFLNSASLLIVVGGTMLVDGQAGDTIKQLLDKERLMTLDHNRSGAKVFTAMADVAPAMGMIGTLIGLVQMLSSYLPPNQRDKAPEAEAASG